MKKLILTSLVVLPVGAYFYHGFDKNHPITESKIGNKTFLYIQHVGKYDKVKDSFEIVDRDLKGDKVLDGARYGAIYYDDPFKIVDPTASRAVVGVWVDSSNKGAAQEVQKRLPNYDIKDISEIPTVKSSIEFKSPLTFVWLNLKQYPKLYNYVKENLGIKAEKVPVAEFYSMKDGHVGTIETHLPYGPAAGQLALSKSPEPKKK